MPKRKTQNKRAGKKQRRRTVMRQRGGGKLTGKSKGSERSERSKRIVQKKQSIILEVDNMNSQSIIDTYEGTNLKTLIEDNIHEFNRNNYVIKKINDYKYKASKITYLMASDNDGEGEGPPGTWAALEGYQKTKLSIDGYKPLTSLFQ